MTVVNRSILLKGRPWRPLLWAGLAALLALPLIAMQFTRAVDWNGADFLAAAMLLVGTAVAIELAVRFIDRPALRVGAVIGAVGCAALIWADGAIGIF
jgi:hypothetical protein